MTLLEATIRIEKNMGLHERFELLYVVDGYQAELSTLDGDVTVERQNGGTVAEAIIALAEKLSPYGRP